MPGLLHELIFARAERTPSAIALRLRDAEQDYATLAEAVGRFAAACAGRDLEAAGRVAIWLPKRFETVAAIFGACAAGGAFVPVNPLLKPEQVGYILNDCNVRILVTDRERARLLAETLAGCPALPDRNRPQPRIPARPAQPARIATPRVADDGSRGAGGTVRQCFCPSR